MISPSHTPLPDNTQHSQQTNIQALGGIRTHDHSRRAAVDLRLRPRGYWDRQLNPLRKKNNLNYTSKFSPYCAVNTRRFGYKNQSVNSACRNNHCLFREPQKARKYVDKTWNFWKLKLVVCNQWALKL